MKAGELGSVALVYLCRRVAVKTHMRKEPSGDRCYSQGRTRRSLRLVLTAAASPVPCFGGRMSVRVK